jgi:hypothetical protein
VPAYSNFRRFRADIDTITIEAIITDATITDAIIDIIIFAPAYS